MRAIPLARSARRRHGLEPIVGRDGTLDATAVSQLLARLPAVVVVGRIYAPTNGG
jgi:hypothetical protein